MITLDQVDQLRRRTNCSYEEAKVLLEKHGGNVLEAIVDFEKSKHNKSYSSNNGNPEQGEWKKQRDDIWKNLKELIQKGFENKVVIEDNNSVLFSISVNIMLLLIIIIPYITVPIMLLFLLLGYNVSIKKTTGNEVNISSIVQDITDRFTGRNQAKNPQDQKEQPTDDLAQKDDYNELTIE